VSRRILALALVLAALVALSSLPGAGASQPSSVSVMEEPRYIVRPTGFGFSLLVGGGRAGPLKVIYISGSPYDRGYEYGYLAAEEIAGVLNWAYNILGEAYGVPGELFRQELLALAREYEPYIPNEYLEEMEGIADGFNYYASKNPSVSLGFNLTHLDILLINSFVDFSCTGAVISGNLTMDGMIISGTTIDAPPVAPYFVYVVERPTSGYQVAYFTAAGSLFQNGFNDAGLSMTEHGVHTWKVVGMPEMIRDRYVVQYASNVSQAIELLKDLFKSGFSGYGDALLLSDAEGNIAVVEVSPYKIVYLVNPREGPTWPPEDPFLEQPRGLSLLQPTNYTVVLESGYDHVLQGSGWIVRQGIYALKDMIVGLPDYPRTWEEAINSENYTWIWDDKRGYLMAHYIYDKVLSGEKLTLEDMVEASKLPLIGDRPGDDGAIWMEPQIGLAVILKGQSSFARPVFLQTFYPIPGAPTAPSASEILNNTITIIQLARQVEEAIGNLSAGNAKALQALTSMLDTLSQELAANSKGLQDSISKLAAQVTANLEAINTVNETCSRLANGQESISNRLEALNTHINNLNQGLNTLENSSNSINTKLDAIKNYTHRIEALTISTLVIALIILGIAALLVTRKT